MTYENFLTLNYAWMALGLAIFIVLLRVPAPYGRHASARWGPQIINRLGWVIMEVPGMTILLYFVLTNLSGQNAMSWTLIAFYLFHYLNRTFIFPMRIRTKAKKMPVLIMGAAILFNLINGTLLGYFFAHFADYQTVDFIKPTFIAGVLLFGLGMYINWDYDNRLIHLRKPGETGYRLPVGGLFNRVSCPNHLGEIIEWAGYALMSWNVAALSFLVWTMANLIPRALAHHRWYREHFSEYPAQRKAIIPFVL